MLFFAADFLRFPIASELTDRKKNKLTTLMILHNMKDAIAHNNRLILN